jgi:hypothetical protein
MNIGDLATSTDMSVRGTTDASGNYISPTGKVEAPPGTLIFETYEIIVHFNEPSNSTCSTSLSIGRPK